MFGLQSLINKTPLPEKPINVWALRKEPRLKSILLILIDSLGQTDWCIDISQKTGCDGVYLVHRDEPALRVYLHVHGQRQGRAGLHLEYPPTSDMGPTLEVYDDLRWSQLVDILAAFFGISEVNMVSVQGNR